VRILDLCHFFTVAGKSASTAAGKFSPRGVSQVPREASGKSARRVSQVRAKRQAAEAEHAATLAALQAKTWDPGKGKNGVIEQGGK
jgi:hypothetical protein